MIGSAIVELLNQDNPQKITQIFDTILQLKTKKKFLIYKSSSYSHIPVYEEFTADLVSPLTFIQIFTIKKRLFI